MCVFINNDILINLYIFYRWTEVGDATGSLRRKCLKTMYCWPRWRRSLPGMAPWRNWIIRQRACWFLPHSTSRNGSGLSMVVIRWSVRWTSSYGVWERGMGGITSCDKSMKTTALLWPPMRARMWHGLNSWCYRAPAWKIQSISAKLECLSQHHTLPPQRRGRRAYA